MIEIGRGEERKRREKREEKKGEERDHEIIERGRCVMKEKEERNKEMLRRT